MANGQIIRIVDRYLANLIGSGMDVSFCVLFGSHVSGRATELSDIDVLVVSREFDEAYGRRALDHLWRVAARTDSRLEPIPVGLQLFSGTEFASLIVEEARQTGKIVKPRKSAQITTPAVAAYQPAV